MDSPSAKSHGPTDPGTATGTSKRSTSQLLWRSTMLGVLVFVSIFRDVKNLRPFQDSPTRSLTDAYIHIGKNASISPPGRESYKAPPASRKNPLPMHTDHMDPISFSACINWMDDRELLIEWLAYHYHVLRLRYVVIGRDVKSTKSLDDIVERWKGRMKIVVWEDMTMFFSEEYKAKVQAINNKVNKFVRTQEEFMRQCAFHLQRNNRTWTAFMDVDELVGFDGRYVPNIEEKIHQPGSVLGFILEQQRLNMSKHYHSKFQSPCIPLVRTEFSPVESSSSEVERLYPDVLKGHIMPERFQTLRFRHAKGKKLIGKTLADISRLDFGYDTARLSVHGLLRGKCEHAWGHKRDPLLLYHYLGSWEAFQRPNDIRAWDRYQLWKDRSAAFWTDKGPLLGDEPRAWLQGFVDDINDPLAVRSLLDGVGFPKNTSTALPVHNASCPGLCIRKYELVN